MRTRDACMPEDAHITTCDFELLSTCAAYVTGLGDKDLRRVRNAEELFVRPILPGWVFSLPPSAENVRKARNLHKSLKHSRSIFPFLPASWTHPNFFSSFLHIYRVSWNRRVIFQI